MSRAAGGRGGRQSHGRRGRRDDRRGRPTVRDRARRLLVAATRRLDPVLALAERVDRRRRRIRPVRRDGVLGVELVRYRGSPVPLRDGTLVSPGDRVVSLHFRNERVRALATAGWQARGRQVVRADLAALARWSGSRPAALQPVAFQATTILGPLAKREGWEIRPRPPSWRTRLDDWYMRWLLGHWRREGSARLDRRRTLASVEAWISGRELHDRYGGQVAGPQGA